MPAQTRRRLKFRAHFNRVNMQRGKPEVWTVHTSRGCFQGPYIDSIVPMHTMYNEDGRQPRAYFTGYADVVVNPVDGGILLR